MTIWNYSTGLNFSKSSLKNILSNNPWICFRLALPIHTGLSKFVSRQQRRSRWTIPAAQSSQTTATSSSRRWWKALRQCTMASDFHRREKLNCSVADHHAKVSSFVSSSSCRVSQICKYNFLCSSTKMLYLQFFDILVMRCFKLPYFYWTLSILIRAASVTSKILLRK